MPKSEAFSIASLEANVVMISTLMCIKNKSFIWIVRMDGWALVEV